MNGAFYIGATGLRTQERALDITANNIANVNSAGFKRSSVRFSEIMPTALDRSDPRTASQQVRMAGVTALADRRVFTQGELRDTGRPLDVAVDGDGFISLLGPDGQALLWRGGTLSINAEGYLAGLDGLALSDLISVPDAVSDLVIERDGTVRGRIDGETQAMDLGHIRLTIVQDMAGLTPLSEGVYAPAQDGRFTSVVPGEEGSGVLQQGALEGSNVELSDEMVMLLLMQRAYAANAQVVQAGDQLMAIANGLRRS